MVGRIKVLQRNEKEMQLAMWTFKEILWISSKIKMKKWKIMRERRKNSRKLGLDERNGYSKIKRKKKSIWNIRRCYKMKIIYWDDDNTKSKKFYIVKIIEVSVDELIKIISYFKVGE